MLIILKMWKQEVLVHLACVQLQHSKSAGTWQQGKKSDASVAAGGRSALSTDRFIASFKTRPTQGTGSFGISNGRRRVTVQNSVSSIFVSWEQCLLVEGGGGGEREMRWGRDESTQMEEGGETFQSPWHVELLISLSRQALISPEGRILRCLVFLFTGN